MKKKKQIRFAPTVSGLIGGGVAAALTPLLCLLCALVLGGTQDPMSYVTVCACLAVGVSGFFGGLVASKLCGAIIGSVFSAVAALLVMAAVSAALPSEPFGITQLIPPVCLTVMSLLGGFVATA